MSFDNLLLMLLVVLVRYLLTSSKEGGLVLWKQPENPPVTPLGFPIVEGWEMWYDEWAHREGSACTWPPEAGSGK